MSFLCQPRRLADSSACEAAANTWCAVSWNASTRLCELRDRARTLDAFDQCVKDRRPEFAKTGLGSSVAIVETMTSNLLQLSTSDDMHVPLREEHKRTTHNVRCWANRHNYSLVIHPVPVALLRTGYSQPYGPRRTWQGVPFDKVNDVRHRVVSQYLKSYEHVLHIDTDTIALNESRSLRPYLRHPAAVTLQVRENGEVAGATYLVRRSAEAACFLSLWDTMGHATHRTPRPMLNTDNGVLLLLVARLLDEPAALECEAQAMEVYQRFALGGAGFHGMYTTYLRCFAQRHTHAMLMERVMPRLPWLRVLFPREGFQRSYESPEPSVGQHHALVSFQPKTDLLGHGWKAMGRLMVQPGSCAPLQVEKSH